VKNRFQAFAFKCKLSRYALELITPDFVHVMKKGKIVQTGDISIAVGLCTLNQVDP
jgi:Fe-S cluster assembly ATPase SufC